ncbi:MAG: hypothetical protein ACOC1U_02100 [Spirochaetota bacterium]
MTLYLTDSDRIARALRRTNEESAEVRTLPKRLTSSAAAVGAFVEELRPGFVVVVATDRNAPAGGRTAGGSTAAGRTAGGSTDPEAAGDEDPSDQGATARLGIVYRCTVAGEAWIPEVSFDHGEEPVEAHAEPPSGPSGEIGVRRVTVSHASAAAIAASVARTSPDRVLAVVAAEVSDGVAERIVRLADQAAQAGRLGDRMRQGRPEVNKTVTLAGEVADRLRLTATQRARFLQAARSAAIRGGEVPHPLQRADTDRVANKAGAKRKLAELERLLSEWKRDQV